MTPIHGKDTDRGREQTGTGDPGDMNGQSFTSSFAVPREVEEIRRCFGYLSREWSFEEVAQKSDLDGSSITWQGEHAAIIVSYSEREKVRVEIARLVDGGSGSKVIPVEGTGYSTPLERNIFDLREVLKFRSLPDFEFLLEANRKQSFAQSLATNADLLGKHCRDLLAGDFSFFEVLNRANAEAVITMCREAGIEPVKPK